MTKPKISIIMPVYNARMYLQKTIEAIQAQIFEDFEVICIDDGSTDESGELIEQLTGKDQRFSLLYQKKAGYGAARNAGFAKANGEYVIFLNCWDVPSNCFLEKLYKAAVEGQTDITACSFSRLDAKGREIQCEGVHTTWIPNDLAVFSYRDCPDYIMRVVDPVLCNKLYRSDFICEKNLKYEEISTAEDVAFGAVSVAAAERVTYISDSLIQCCTGHEWDASCGADEKLNNIKRTVFSGAKQAHTLPHCDVIHNAILSFVVGNLIVSLTRYIKNFSAPEAKDFYQMVHDTFNRVEFADIDAKKLRNPKQYLEFCTVKKHDYEAMRRLIKRRIVVSLTSYPRRIGTITQVLATIYNQTRKADEVVLWLAEEQFPKKEAKLPKELLQLVAEKRLTIRWCEDLKAHKKYFYALQEYTNDLVVTVDDDLLCPPDMLNSLYRSYLLFPDAISTMRAHLILVSEQDQILPYNAWIQETDVCIHQPCMQLMATGGAGVLYPPNLLRKEFFDKEAIMQISPLADDLWLKAAQLMSGVPVVVAHVYEPLQYIPGSQEDGLYQRNVRQNQNDIQLRKISEWLDKRYGPGSLAGKLKEKTTEAQILGIEAVSSHLDTARKTLRRNLKLTNGRLKAAEDEKKRTEAEVIRLGQELLQVECELKRTKEMLSQMKHKLEQTECRLAKTESKLQIVEESKPIGRQLSGLKKLLQEQKKAGFTTISLWLKHLIYLLAWVPEKILVAMMGCIQYGFTYTVKLGIRKIFRRG